MKKLFYLIAVVLASVSCGGVRDAESCLRDVETYIKEHPDSALAVLNSIDLSRNRNKRIWAHYSLLHAQAEDKCYIDETDDSLMALVVDYYQNRRDKEKLFNAYYYLGRIQYNAGSYTESMLSYTKAEQLIDNIDDDFVKGLLYAQLGTLHEKYYDYQRSLGLYETAYACYESAGKTAHQYYSKLNIGQIYLELKDYTSSEKVLVEVLAWAYENRQEVLGQYAIRLLINLYDETHQNCKIHSLLNSEYGELCHDSLPIIQIRAYELARQKDSSASELICEADGLLRNTSDTICNLYYKYRILKELGYYEDALANHEHMIFLQDSITFRALQQPLLSVKNDYLQAENRYMHLKVNVYKTQKLAAILALCISVCCMTVYFRHKIKGKNIEMLGYIEVATELGKILINKHQEIETISKNLAVMDSELKTCEGYISEMFYRQYELLNKLVSTYYETHVCNKDMEAIYRQVSIEIKRLSSDKNSILQLEDFVNRYKGNIMVTIRTYLPALTEIDYRLLCYSCAGFSAKAISIFTGSTTNNIYVRKSRIKDKIAELADEGIRSEILDAITVK